jgi:hypothetical protein
VERREQQRVDHRVNAPAVAHDPAHQVADGVAGVKDQRAALHLREQIGGERVDHPLPGVGPQQRQDDLEDAADRKQHQRGQRDPRHEPGRRIGAREQGDAAAPGWVEWLAAQHVVDEHHHRQRLEDGGGAGDEGHARDRDPTPAVLSRVRQQPRKASPVQEDARIPRLHFRATTAPIRRWQ